MDILNTASNQLFRRPSDEHFASMGDIMADAESSRDRSYESMIDLNSPAVFFSSRGEEDSNSLYISLPDNSSPLVSNYALQQISTYVGIPVRSLEKMGARDMDLVVRNLNTMIRQGSETFERNLYIERGRNNPESLNLRSLNGADYTRLHDATILRAIHELLLPSGMIPALPTMNTDINRNNIMGNNKPCLFRGDRDSFCFFMEDQTPNDDLGGLRIGLMFSNSEVGTSSFKWTTLYFRDICANFLIWGAQDIKTTRLIHRGNIAPRWSEFQHEITRIYEHAQKRKGEDLTVFARAAQTPFVGDGSPTQANKEAAVKILSGAKKLKMSKRHATNVVGAALLPQNGGNLSVWSVVNGVTHEAKDTVNVSTMVDSSIAANAILASV